MNAPQGVDVLAVIEHDGDRWRVLATGAKDEAGRVLCHLASTTRFIRQRNGDRPVQIADWVAPEVLAIEEVRKLEAELTEARAAVAELVEAQQAMLAGIAPIINELHNGQLNGVIVPGRAGDLGSLASEIVRLVSPVKAALSRTGGV